MLRIWDCLILEGRKVLFRVSLGLLLLHQGTLVKMHSLEQVLGSFKQVLMHTVRITLGRLFSAVSLRKPPGALLREAFARRLQVEHEELMEVSFHRLRRFARSEIAVLQQEAAASLAAPMTTPPSAAANLQSRLLHSYARRRLKLKLKQPASPALRGSADCSDPIAASKWNSPESPPPGEALGGVSVVLNACEAAAVAGAESESGRGGGDAFESPKLPRRERGEAPPAPPTASAVGEARRLSPTQTKRPPRLPRRILSRVQTLLSQHDASPSSLPQSPFASRRGLAGASDKPGGKNAVSICQNEGTSKWRLLRPRRFVGSPPADDPTEVRGKERRSPRGSCSDLAESGGVSPFRCGLNREGDLQKLCRDGERDAPNGRRFQLLANSSFGGGVRGD